jgi:hypothetical protein
MDRRGAIFDPPDIEHGRFQTHLPPNPKRQNPVKELNLLNQPF